MRLRRPWRGAGQGAAGHGAGRSAVALCAGPALWAVLLTTVVLADPRTPGHYPGCPFRAVTGWSCPGCGSLRALADLTDGHLGAALGHNAALVAFLPVAAGAWLRRASGRPALALPRHTAAAALVALLLWTVVRNLPTVRAVLAQP